MNKGLLIPDASFKFVENTGIGQYLATGNAAPTISYVRYMKLAKPITKGITALNVVATGIAVTDDFNHGRYKSAAARGTVAIVAAGVAFIPVAGWAISAGIGVADAIWGDDFYNWIEK
ncbi:hypothetical protein [Taibaiella chishuiensis]|uniref:hypothetical protein n=1 Tax=Taibaiella chishuiensis TaxID=1434707 RepID=UPI000D0D086F|nr:hypothetical protein [Taibaiella chishuiensis]